MATPILFDRDMKIPSTRKGMDALVAKRLVLVGEREVANTINYDKFSVGNALMGILTARHDYIRYVHFIDDAERILRSPEMGRGSLSSEYLDHCSLPLKLTEAGHIARKEYADACTRIGIKLWAAFRLMSFVETGDKIVGQFGTLNQTLVLSGVVMNTSSPSEMVRTMGGEVRTFRRRATKSSQLYWLKDHDMACFSSHGFNFKAVATLY